MGVSLVVIGLGNSIDRFEKAFDYRMPPAVQASWVNGLRNLQTNINAWKNGMQMRELITASPISESLVTLERDVHRRMLDVQERLLKSNVSLLLQSVLSQYYLLNAQGELQSKILRESLDNKEHKHLFDNKKFDKLTDALNISKPDLVSKVQELQVLEMDKSFYSELWNTVRPLEDIAKLEVGQQRKELLLLHLDELSRAGNRVKETRLKANIEEELSQQHSVSEKELKVISTLISLKRLTETTQRKISPALEEYEKKLFKRLKNYAELTDKEITHLKELQRQDRKNFRKRTEITNMPKDLNALKELGVMIEKQAKIKTSRVSIQGEKRKVTFSDTQLPSTKQYSLQRNDPMETTTPIDFNKDQRAAYGTYTKSRDKGNNEISTNWNPTHTPEAIKEDKKDRKLRTQQEVKELLKPHIEAIGGKVEDYSFATPDSTPRIKIFFKGEVLAKLGTTPNSQRFYFIDSQKRKTIIEITRKELGESMAALMEDELRKKEKGERVRVFSVHVKGNEPHYQQETNSFKRRKGSNLG